VTQPVNLKVSVLLILTQFIWVPEFSADYVSNTAVTELIHRDGHIRQHY